MNYHIILETKEDTQFVPLQ